MGATSASGARTNLGSGGPLAYVASGSAATSGKISWGTGAVPSLAEGEIYLKYA
jgi:hypothetical protein